MADEILFTVKEENLETGLRGYPVGYCTTSSVDPQRGLLYMQKPVSEMTHWKPEKVIDLLYHGRIRTDQEVAEFTSMLRKRAHCGSQLLTAIRQLPRQGHPMKLFSSALLLCGMLEGSGDYREDCLNLIAKAPILAANVINYHAGWTPSGPSRPDLGYVENFAYMLNLPPQQQSKPLTELFTLFNILHYDHGGGNLSAFVGKAIASGLADLYESMSGAMCALAGHRHGMANQDGLELVRQVFKDLGADATSAQVTKWVKDRLEQHELIYGFGHAVLRAEDPRAALFYQFADEHFPNDPLIKTARLLRKEVPEILKQQPKISNPYPNIDAISGATFCAAGFPYPEYYTVLFAMARVVGIGIQIVYERYLARDGRGTPIVRPKYFFKEVLQ